MTRQAPWSVKGISPQAREAAKDLARREGMPIGEWLSGLISEVAPGAQSQPAQGQPGLAPSQQPQSYLSSEPAPSHRYAQPVFDPSYTQSSKPDLQPFPGTSEHPAAAMRAGTEQSRLVEVLESLTRRLDPSAMQAPIMPVAANYQSGPSHAALERALNELAHHVESRDRHISRSVGQMDAGLSEIQQTQDALSERLRRMEANNPEHKSLAALRSLEGALAQLDRDMRALQAAGPDTDLSDRVGQLEAVQVAAIERLDTMNAATNQQVSSLAAASGNLADRLLDLEKAHDEADTSIGARVDQLETLATQGLEETDRGIGLLNERIAATEVIAQQINERFAEAMIDLSARLAALENADHSEASNAAVDGILAQVHSIDARVTSLDQRVSDDLAATREALRAEVSATLADGMDARFSQLASALAARLDATEQSSTATMERIGNEVAKIAETLDQRVTTLESDDSRKDPGMAFKLEVARISRAIDERLTQIEEKAVGAPDETNRKIDALGQSLDARIGGIEQRSMEAARGAAAAASADMQELIRRLETRQSEASEALARRIGEAEERAERRMEDRFRSVEREIAAAEDRAKAVSAPLHRGFETLLDRIDSIEAGETVGYAETVTPPDYRVGFAAAPAAPMAPAAATADAGWRGGFASPFPGDPIDPPQSAAVPSAGFGAPDLLETDRFGQLDDPLVIDDTGEVDDVLGPFADGGFLNDPAALGVDTSDVEVWPMDDAIAAPVAPQSGSDYLSNARRAAIEAAQADAVVAANKKQAKGPAKKAGKAPATAKTADKQAKTKAPKAAGTAKAGLSPVGMVAAAGLVLTVGVAGYNHFTKASAQDEMPEALANPQPAAAAAVAPDTIPDVEAPTGLPAGRDMMPANEAAQSGPLEGAQVPPVAPSTAATPTAPTAATAPATDGTARPRVVTPSPQLERLSQQEAAKAQAARSQAARTPPTRPSATTARPAAQARPQTATTPRAAREATPAAPPRIASGANARPARPQAASADAASLLNQARQRRQAGDAAGAAALMRQAADGGSVAAQNELAGMYERGEGVPRDMAQARRLTERAAASGSRRAQHNMGVYYTEGEAATRDYNRARESFTAAARRGNTDSQYNLGAMAEQGLGREASRADAAYWYGVAGRGGDQEAARQAERVRSQLSPEEQAQVDARVTSFQAEAASDD